MTKIPNWQHLLHYTHSVVSDSHSKFEVESAPYEPKIIAIAEYTVELDEARSDGVAVTEGVEKKDDYIDPKGYFADPGRKVRRTGNEGVEQEILIRTTEACSKAEWLRTPRK